MIYGLEPEILKPFALYAVVHYVSKTEQPAAMAQFILGLAYCGEHAETETGVVVYLYSHNVSVGSSLEVLVHKPFVLLVKRHVAVVKDYGIIGLAQRRNCTVRVNVITFTNIL